jgi:hypothetical protein
MAEVDAPVAMDFAVGTTEQKMDMSLGTFPLHYWELQRFLFY